MLIQYNGFREPHRDGIYETGDWTIGMIKDVPDAVALKMLKHPDVYAVARADEAPAQIEQVMEKTDRREDEEAQQTARDAVAAMAEKDAIASYAMNNFGLKIPKTLTLENMKQRAIMYIDQYGA